MSIICKSAYCYLRDINRIRKFLSHSDTEKIVHTFRSSCVDSRNSLFAGLPVFLNYNLLSFCIQNTVTRLVRARKFDHISDILMCLHRPSIHERVNYKEPM
ncbi:hypothetical protein HOLleu_18133 [Holothuria leucospilota]|uniref:Uncharacterized protein n=1 Tax=Holothuria leucospilota TaxID=206669 RepID=A0A9Q1C1B9_HOLLE|nr:hypothetical protein HOLleu_18133 [Holothuria leucospilota]